MTTVRVRMMTVLGVVLLALGLAAPGQAQVPPDEADYSAYSNGAVIHAEGLEQPTLQDPTSTRVVDAEVAFSGAVADTAGLAADQHSEYGALVMPAQQGKNSYGRGYGMDLAVAEQGGTDDPQLRLAGLAEAAAPPQDGPNRETVGPVDADPLAYASTLEGQAYANWVPDQCILGSDISYGTGLAEDAELVDLQLLEEGGEAPEEESLEQPLLSTNAADPERAVSWSNSRNFLGPQTNEAGEVIGRHAGVIAETRQTIAPVTFFAGTDAEFTIEFLGEWVLRAHAGGVPGSAYVHYGPGEVSPETPVLRIIQETEETVLTLQDLLTDEGLVIDALPLAEIAIGEDPRAIGGTADSEPQISGDGTHASAAVDVVRVKLLSEAGVGEAAEVRVGHMEVSATAPQGGIDCGIPVQKQPDQATVRPGDTFTYTIRADNPYDCVLRDVRIVDRISGSEGVTWTVDATDPQAAQVSDTEIVWTGLGPIEPGGSEEVTITVTVGSDSQTGVFRDEATVTGVCFDQPVEGEDEAAIGVPLEGQVGIDAPRVEGGPAVAGPALPRTGGGALVSLAGLALAGAAGALWRKR